MPDLCEAWTCNHRTPDNSEINMFQESLKHSLTKPIRSGGTPNDLLIKLLKRKKGSPKIEMGKHF